jgi:CRP-like cAMP-binding protein
MAMQSINKLKGEVVIQQGDDGDNLYIVETGSLVCTKIIVSNSS